MSAPAISAERVQELFRHCLGDEGDDGVVLVEGVVRSAWFDPSKIEQNRDDIRSILMELPTEFRKSSVSGGWSFLNACNDQHGHLWGQHINIEQLLLLGIGAGLAKMLLPRKMWDALPGGMPYFVVLDQDESK